MCYRPLLVVEKSTAALLEVLCGVLPAKAVQVKYLVIKESGCTANFPSILSMPYLRCRSTSAFDHQINFMLSTVKSFSYFNETSDYEMQEKTWCFEVL